MLNQKYSYSAQMGDKTITFETGNIAEQAGGAVTASIGDTLVLTAATMSEEPRPGINFFPLTVDYEERMYAGGRIPGGFFRREGRPSEQAVLTARLTDRPLRPLFPKDLRNDVQVIIYSLSADGENPIDIIAINAASAAMMISDIPWNGPIGAVRISRLNGKFVVNPTFAEADESDLDLRVAGTRESILMVECGANEVSEEVLIEAIQLAHDAIQPVIELQIQMAEEIGKPKREGYPRFTVDENLTGTVAEMVTSKLNEILSQGLSKVELRKSIDEVKEEAIATLVPDPQQGVEPIPTEGDVTEAFNAAYKAVVRKRILENGQRPDGRSLKEIRPIWCEVNYSPRAHGSGLFTRGETQILTLATLGTPREAQEMDNLTPVEKKRYIHHYNFPPFSVGETRFLRGASRREVGHGALAERAMLSVIPEETDFPYTMRLVSEALSSNGSTSMGSVCGSTLALMDAGVPIRSPVSGIAMGLVKEGDQYAILSDIQGLEDHLGDMDFKVAGTKEGVNALQMDIKATGITPEIMKQALEQAYEGRVYILNKMLEVISEPRPDLKPHTPRISTIQIPTDKIGALIGPGGKNIRGIQDDTGAKIDIEEDGTVFIATEDGESERRAREMIELYTESPQVGRIYTGKVVRVTDFGAFVEVLPGMDGLVHISQLDTEHVKRVEDIARTGDEITVMITNIDDAGKIRLSRQAVLEGWTLEEARENDRIPGKRKSSHRGGRGRRN